MQPLCAHRRGNNRTCRTPSFRVHHSKSQSCVLSNPKLRQCSGIRGRIEQQVSTTKPNASPGVHDKYRYPAAPSLFVRRSASLDARRLPPRCSDSDIPVIHSPSCPQRWESEKMSRASAQLCNVCESGLLTVFFAIIEK